MYRARCVKEFARTADDFVGMIYEHVPSLRRAVATKFMVEDGYILKMVALEDVSAEDIQQRRKEIIATLDDKLNADPLPVPLICAA